MIAVILFAMSMYTEPKCCGSQTVVRGPLGDMKSLKGTLRGIVFNGLAFTLYDFLYLYCMKAYTHAFIKIKFIGILRLRIAEI